MKKIKVIKVTEANGRGFDNLTSTSVWPGAVCFRPWISRFLCSKGLENVLWSLTAKVGEPNKNVNVGIQKLSLSSS